MTGDFDFAGDRGNLAVDFPEGGISHIDEIFTDGRVYVSGLSQMQGKWAVLPHAAAEAHFLLRAPLNDPEHVLEQLASIHETTRVAPLFPGGRLRIPADVWLDSEGRVVRTRLTLRQAGMDVVTTTTLSRHGTPVHATAPAAEQTAPVDTIQGALPG